MELVCVMDRLRQDHREADGEQANKLPITHMIKMTWEEKGQRTWASKIIRKEGQAEKDLLHQLRKEISKFLISKSLYGAGPQRAG